MREGFRNEAELSARADLGLRAVAFAEGIDADEADVEAHLALMAAQSGQPDTDLDELREGMASAGHLLELLADLRKQAAMDWLFEQVGFVDEEGNEIDRDDLRPSEPEVVIPGEEPEAAEAVDPDPDPDSDHEQEPSA